jgi:hypothetical protein
VAVVDRGVTTLVQPRSTFLDRRAAGIAAVASTVTMPLTAMWFLLLGGLLLVGGLVGRLVRDDPSLGRTGSIGLGLLAGPAVYLGLAVLS